MKRESEKERGTVGWVERQTIIQFCMTGLSRKLYGTWVNVELIVTSVNEKPKNWLGIKIRVYLYWHSNSNNSININKNICISDFCGLWVGGRSLGEKLLYSIDFKQAQRSTYIKSIKNVSKRSLDTKHRQRQSAVNLS